jgi:hypothetical protein
MRNVLKIVVGLACLAIVPPVALAATATSGKPDALNCFREQLKPKRIGLACADGGIWLGKLKWSSWGSASAKGAGIYNQNDCTPTCSNGKIESYPVKVTLSKVKTCPGLTHPIFKRATLIRADGKSAKVTFRCPPLPGEQ